MSPPLGRAGFEYEHGVARHALVAAITHRSGPESGIWASDLAGLLGFGFDPATQRRYGSALDDVVERIAALDFDVALIAAGGIATGMSRGGHLQVMFGVHGQRWLSRREWREEIINDAWIGVSDRYRPDPAWTVEDYW